MSDYVRGLRAKIGTDLLLMPSVAALIRDGDGRALLVRHVEGRWQPPGGAVDPGETPVEACVRECREEASIEVEPLRVLDVFGGPEYTTTYANGDRIAYVVTLYDTRIVGGTPAPGDDETQDVGWFAPDDLDSIEMHPAARATLRAALATRS
jgi:8-oxo-dGTP pyrophosphatase MutT (NUDIX family)